MRTACYGGMYGYALCIQIDPFEIIDGILGEKLECYLKKVVHKGIDEHCSHYK